MKIFPRMVCLVFFVTVLVGSVVPAQEVEQIEDELMLFEELPVVISASLIPQEIHQAPANVRIITAEQIKQRGYFTLEEALSDLPGFQFRNILGFNSYVFQRGLPNQNDKILLMIDGLTINELNSGGFYGGGQYNLSHVEKIEVVYGPASALYGTNAISGIINIITRKPEDFRDSGHISLLAGNFNTRSADFSYGSYNQKNEVGFCVSGMFKSSEKADLRAEKGDYNWTNAMENFEDDGAFDAQVKFKNFRCGLVFQDKQASRTTNYTMPDYLDRGTNWHITFFTGYANYTYHKDPDWSLFSQLYYKNATVVDDTIGFIKTGQSGYQRGYYRPNEQVGIENRLTLKTGQKFTFISGIVVEWENLAEGFATTDSASPYDTPPAPSRPKMLHNDLKSFFLQTQYRFRPDFELTAGFRYDQSSVYDEVITPRASLVYNRKTFTAKLMYSEAFRAPKPWNYLPSNGIFNPDLEPEDIRSAEFAVEYKFGKGIESSIALYRNLMQGTITKITDPDTGKNICINLGELSTDGFEFSVQVTRGKLTSYGNYTYTSSIDENDEPIAEISYHTANLGIYYNFTPHITVDLRGNYLGKRKNPQLIAATGDDEIDDAFVVNSTISLLKSDGFDFDLILKNLGDVTYHHSSNLVPERYRQPQRTIMFRIACKL
ncbi:TonB-dependent receptor plug domain-containing protein [candidate division CSSED10-310 bacterium]|uniref:TonB-dependent receptor plug domain-containing protein n=1 Tax=candidate division CSSED10-310 bacterium TaxID=2855610 RepID=A0ABV6Z3W8_UNCC1